MPNSFSSLEPGYEFFCCCDDAELVDCKQTSKIDNPTGMELIYQGDCPVCKTHIKVTYTIVR